MGPLRGGQVSENLLYALGTLGVWLGAALAVSCLVTLIGMFLPSASSDRNGKLIRVAVLGLLAAVLLTLGGRLPAAGVTAGAGVHVPLVWVVLPFWGWTGVVAVAFALIRTIQAMMSLPEPGRNGLIKAATIWAAVGAVAIFLYTKGDEPANVLRGGLQMSLTALVAIALLIVAGSAAMTLAGQQAKVRGWTKTVFIHSMLIAGSVVFGLPFAWLLITSFKEDRDMSSPNGLVWIPKVQQTVKYMDARDPRMQGTYDGRTVFGSIIRTQGDDVQVEIVDPGSLRGLTFDTQKAKLKEVPKDIPLVTASFDGQPIQGKVTEEFVDGRKRVEVTMPASIAGKERIYKPNEVEPVREVGLKWQNYTEALDNLPPQAMGGLVYLKNTLIIVLFSVIGTVLSSSVVAYAFARMRFPGRDTLFVVLLATMMLPGAVTLLPKFLIFRQLGWIDTLYPLWVPAFFASAFNVFLLRQFFRGIPAELEDAARIDGCSPPRTFWSVMLPLVKPALAVIAIWAFTNAWNNFMDPLVYISSPERMPLSYALQLFQGERQQNEPGMLMAFATLTMMPVLLLFFFAQRYFVEGVTLSGLGGR